MPTSQNGWPATSNARSIDVRPLVIGRANIAPGVAYHHGNAVVLQYVFTQFHHRVEKLRPGWCWGYYYRQNRNSSGLSNHASATAGDANAPLHPNGVPRSRNLSPKQIDTIHDILREVNSTPHGVIVRWGGDYTRTVDAMHFEIVGSQTATLAVSQLITMGKIGKKTTLPVKVITGVKPAPSVTKARKTVREATGASTVNVNAIAYGVEVNDDVRDVQKVLNAWYPSRSVEVDGDYGDMTHTLLNFARQNFGVALPLSTIVGRTRTLRKLGLTVLNTASTPV